MSVTALVAAVMGSAKVSAALHGAAGAVAKSAAQKAAGESAGGLLRFVKPTEQERVAWESVRLFAKVWFDELKETTPLKSSLPGYQDQLEDLLAAAASEIAECLDPEAKDVDLGPIERIWYGVKTTDLPERFDWTHVARNFERALKKQIRGDAELRNVWNTVQQERAAEAAERTAEATRQMAGPRPRFDLEVYRKFLIEQKCNALQLATLDFRMYADDRRIQLWNIFVPQSARESAPVMGISPELLRNLREEGHFTNLETEGDLEESLRRYQSSPIRPILEILDPNAGRTPRVVVIGDPGAGKSALLKYKALQWAQQGEGPIPVLIDLKEYGKKRDGVVKFCASGLTLPTLDEIELDKAFRMGEAAFYLDGLDEIFDPQTRQSVMKEIAALSSDYPKAPIVMTSRKVGYQPETLTTAGFSHATLEEFDREQMMTFLERWYEVAEAEDEQRRSLLDRLRRAIEESASIRELAGNPLLLTMMAILNRNEELPRNRVALYRKASEVLLHEWDAHRALVTAESLDREEKETLLRELAGEMQQAGDGLALNLIAREPLIKNFKASLDSLGVTESRKNAVALVKQLEARNFILASAGAQRFSFVHRTFLEYFCADWFVHRLQHTRELTLEQLKQDVFGKHWKDEKWREVLRLIIGLISGKDAGEIIDFLMQQDGTETSHTNLIVAAECLYEVRNRKAVQATDQALWIRFTNWLDGLGASRDYDAFDTDNIEFAVRNQAVKSLYAAWPAEKVKPWLRKTAETSSDSLLRWAAVESTARHERNKDEAFQWLRQLAMTTERNEVQWKIVELIGSSFCGDENALEFLLALAGENSWERIRRSALTALRDFPEDDRVNTLFKDRAQNDLHWFVRAAAVRSLRVHKEDYAEVYNIVRKGVRDEDELVRRSAVRRLSDFVDEPETLTLLRKVAMKDGHSAPRTAALEFLTTTWRNHAKTLDIVLNAARDGDEEVRSCAIDLLRQNWPGNEEAALLVSTNSSDSNSSTATQII